MHFDLLTKEKKVIFLSYLKITKFNLGGGGAFGLVVS